jgi:soluble lytic murein transglycosylase-like protein
MGNVIGEYESEEERRRREQTNQPVKQTITYNPDGTSEVTIKGTPEALSSANPNTPTVSGPVSPDDTYERMLKAESNNRQFTKSGQVVTSPKGALGAGQIMPATAMQPGYGVKNIFDLANERGIQFNQRDENTAKQLLGNEQLNREFGQNYFNAMQRQFPGQPAGAVASYNAGPGAVARNIRQNQGQLNVAQLHSKHYVTYIIYQKLTIYR